MFIYNIKKLTKYLSKLRKIQNIGLYSPLLILYNSLTHWSFSSSMSDYKNPLSEMTNNNKYYMNNIYWLFYFTKLCMISDRKISEVTNGWTFAEHYIWTLHSIINNVQFIHDLPLIRCCHGSFMPHDLNWKVK